MKRSQHWPAGEGGEWESVVKVAETRWRPDKKGTGSVPPRENWNQNGCFFL